MNWTIFFNWQQKFIKKDLLKIDICAAPHQVPVYFTKINVYNHLTLKDKIYNIVIMSGVRWRFKNQKTEAEIIVYDPISAANLNEILINFCPEWKPQKETLKNENHTPFVPNSPLAEYTTVTLTSSTLKTPTSPITPPPPPPLTGVSPRVMGPPKLRPAGMPPLAPPPPLFQPSAPTPPAEKTGAERRKFKRFNLTFRVILTYGKTSYRTFTEDISIGGMKLKQKVPPFFLGKVCKVFISRIDTPENIEITCNILTDDPCNPIRVMFTDTSQETAEMLEKWFEAMSEQIRGHKAA